MADNEKRCGDCARMRHQWRYCPVTAASVSPMRPAGQCKFFLERKKALKESREGERDVC